MSLLQGRLVDAPDNHQLGNETIQEDSCRQLEKSPHRRHRLVVSAELAFHVFLAVVEPALVVNDDHEVGNFYPAGSPC